MIPADQGEGWCERLPYVIFRSLKVGDEIYAVDDDYCYAFRILSEGDMPLVELRWLPHPAPGEPQVWLRGPVGMVSLMGHCQDVQPFTFTNEEDEQSTVVVPVDPVEGELALGRRLWLSYEREDTGTYPTHASGPLRGLFAHRPGPEAGEWGA